MLLEEVVSEITTTNIFSEGGNIMTGFVTMSTNFVSSLWNSNAIGKVIVLLPIIGAAIGLAYRVYLRRKHV